MQLIDSLMARSRTAQLDKAMTLCCPIILRHDDSEVLLLERNGRFSLPRLEIPRWQRSAPHLILAVQRTLGVDIVCRFSFAIDHGDARLRYFVLDLLDSSLPGFDTTTWVAVDEIYWADSEPTTARELFYATLQQAKQYSLAEPPIPFARPEWFREVTDWTQSTLDPYGLRLNGRWQQYNMGPAFALIRYETDGVPVWFKAVGKLNLREYEITQLLATLRLPHAPRLLAVRSDWQAWLMLDVGGSPIDETSPRESWKTAARSLAELQIRSVAHSASLISAGCEDLRTDELHRQMKPFLKVLAQLMQVQPATTPRILDAGDLCFIEASLRHAIDELESLCMPNTLGHTDLNPGNLLGNEGKATFLDWMQSHVGHPFLTFEYLRALLNRLRPDLDGQQADIQAAYCHPWKHFCSESQMERALKVTPLVAPLAFGISAPGWKEGVYGMNPYLAKALRSIGRRMFHEAQKQSPHRGL
jgi:hypothetical protein